MVKCWYQIGAKSYLYLFCLLSAAQPALLYAEPEAEKVYTVGVVPQFEALRLYGIWQPILKQLEKDSGLKLKFKGSPSISEFESNLLAGEFDFAYMNPYQMIKAHKNAGYVALLKDLSKQLQGILVVHKNSPITTIKQLDGKTLAFPDPNALGASLMIRAELANKYNITIKPKYVKNHDSVYLNVIYKKVDAGGGVQKTLSRQKKIISNQLRILYRTQKVPPHPIGVHPRVKPEVAKRIQQAFLKLSKTKVGEKLIAKIPMKEIGTASITEYKIMSNMGLGNFEEKQ